MMSSKPYYEDVFVVLTYKNTADIVLLLDSIFKNTNNSRIIIVNNYYDDSTVLFFKDIAIKYNCDYISRPNNGYGAGNNAGIEYALEHYEFRRIVISNPDILLKRYDQNLLNGFPEGVYGGEITNLKGKIQNPLRVLNTKFTNYSNYYALVENKLTKFYISIIISKLLRLLVYRIKRNYIRVFALHGSFFIMSKSIIDNLAPLFDENIFLFDEEIDISNRFADNKIPVFFTHAISVLHKEDGDMNISSINHSQVALESSQYVYNKWNRSFW